MRSFFILSEDIQSKRFDRLSTGSVDIDNQKENKRKYIAYEKKKNDLVKKIQLENATPYEDLTEELRKMNADVESVERRLNYAMDKDMRIYYSKYFDLDKDLVEEIKYRELMERKTGYKVYLNPKTTVRNVRTPDFWIEDLQELWDYKGIDGSKKNTIDNIIHKAESQTYNLILRQRNTEFDIDTIKNQITDLFDRGRRPNIKQLILLDRDDNIILYYKRQ